MKKHITSRSKLKYAVLAVILMVFTNCILAQEMNPPPMEFLKRDAMILPKVKVIPIKDTQNNRQYELYVKLPEGYSDTVGASYPVIYFTDAIWHVEVISGSAEYIIENAILVGISWQKDMDQELVAEAGEHVSRYRDYSIQPAEKPEIQTKYNLGQGSKHLAFIEKDVIPYVERNFKTEPDNRTYFGYSAGGLFGAYIATVRPNTFKNYILGSPSVWRNMPLLTQFADEKKASEETKANVFISYGSKETELETHIKSYVELVEEKMQNTLSLEHIVVDGTHQSAFPMTAVRGLYWLAEKLETGKKMDSLTGVE